MSQDKRGQAALEFLTTYGWAFLVILIMISALAYFGVLSPQNFLPERCNLQQELQCQDYQLELDPATGNVNMSLQLRNQVGNSINIQGMTVDTNPEAITGTTTCVGNAPIQLAGSGSTTVSCEVTGNFPAEGSKQKIGFTITYQEIGGRFNHTVSGEVYATLQ